MEQSATEALIAGRRRRDLRAFHTIPKTDRKLAQIALQYGTDFGGGICA
jgi:hypothetical protein